MYLNLSCKLVTKNPSLQTRGIRVSESHLQSIRNYIHNQEEHHSKKTFNDEVNEFMVKYGWSFIKEE